MPATNFTPIQLYRSTTASQVPTSGNLSDGELAINTNDEKLYFKNSGGTVKLLASSAGASGDVVGPASATDNAVVRFDGTTGKLVQNSVVTIADSTGDVAGVGALTMGGNLTLSGGTANGVLYLNGSKVATSGSALTFDGTEFKVNAASGNVLVQPSNVANAKLYMRHGSIGNNNGFEVDVSSNTIFLQAGSEAMRLTSTGLGIGTSSPAQKLTVAGGIASTTAISALAASTAFFDFNSGSARFAAVSGTTGTAASILFSQYSSNGSVGRDAMVLDSSGNLGLGVTPSFSWTNTSSASFEVKNVSFSAIQTNDLHASSNAYYVQSAAQWRYLANSVAASNYYQSAGAHVWRTAPSGTAGNAVTWTQAMTLDASGNLLVGTTTAAYATAGRGLYELNGSSTSLMALKTGDTARGYFAASSSVTELAAVGASQPLLFTTNAAERARITSGGKLLLGTTTTGGTLTVDGVDAISTGNSSTYAITCGNDVADGLAFGSDASYAYIQSFSSKSIVINKEGNEVLVAGTTDNGAYNLQCNGTGVWGAGAYVNGSDERLKDNIQTLNDGLAVVSQLRPVTFQYKPEHSKDQSVQPGFIAQELQQAMAGKPYLDGVVMAGPEYLNVAYQNLIPILTKAIQEQQALITSLTARVALLEGN